MSFSSAMEFMSQNSKSERTGLRRILELWHRAHTISYVECECIGSIDLSQEYFRILCEIKLDREVWVATHKSMIYGLWKVEAGSYEAAYSAMIGHIREQVEEVVFMFIHNHEYCEEKGFEFVAAKVAEMYQIYACLRQYDHASEF